MKIVDMDALWKGIEELIGNIDVYLPVNFIDEFAENYIVDIAPQWIPCEKELPNENDIFYNGVGIDNERKVSDRVLAIDSDGFIRTGYFIKACNPHKYYGKGIRDGYSSPGIAEWDFGEHYMGDPNNWVCGSGLDIVAWMPLPELYEEERRKNDNC